MNLGRWQNVGYEARHYVEIRTGRVIGIVDGGYRVWNAYSLKHPGETRGLGEFDTEANAKRAVEAACAAASAKRRGR